MAGVQLAADLGYGVSWLLGILIIAIISTTGFFVYVVLSTKFEHKVLRGKDGLKYKLHKYHAERYWSIFVAGILVWFFFLGLPWAPPVPFHNAVQNPQNVHTIGVTAGQWFWKLEDLGTGKLSPSSSSSSSSSNNGVQSSGQVKVKVGETVKFVAHSLDVNHGFGILKSSNSMDSPLLQMQVVPGFDNIFYYTFKKAGTYTIRCLEYCGWNHPYMLSQITIQAA
jgi:heme/copper-type cytochrome/quinol oxidase subunit 2